jgi:signal transduction histidine kinase
VQKQPAVRGTSYIAISGGALVLAVLYLASLYSYLLFHVLAELFSIAVAWGIFMVAWNSRRFHDNGYLLFVSISLVFVGILDLVHVLAYKGMNVFQGYDANLPTQLWIAARYLESLSLLIAPLFLRRRLRTSFTFLGYAALTAFVLASTLYWRVFPDCYIEGSGLTPFKRISEYIISLILLAAIVVLWRARQAFDRRVFRLLIASLAVTVCSELAFTRYVSVYGFSNLVGHFLKVLSFYLIYKAFIETCLVRPYDLLFRELKQGEEALRRENQELEAFAHTVAHDLKNPLALLTGFAELVRYDHDAMSDQELLEHLQTMVQAGRKMSNIIDELLLLAGVRKTEAETEPLDMASIVLEAQKRLAYLIEERQAEVIVPDASAWPAALGHAPWVEEVWVNYLSNALEYGGTPPRVELGATAQADGMVRFWVRDNGPGIPPEQQGRLFTPFTQLSQVRTEGHGLGLSIVQRIVEKLHGHVWVQSAPGQGSTFFFTMPGPEDTTANGRFARDE